MDGFVSAYSKTTGEKQRIPERWLEHPVLGADFELTPSAKAKHGQRATQSPAGTEPDDKTPSA